MADGRGISARQVAVNVLDQFDIHKRNAREILHGLLKQTAKGQQATDLVFGTIRNLTAIDMVITRIGGVPVDRINRKVVNILRVGTYELVYAPATAEYAIVNEAVKLAKKQAGTKQGGFVNAILRKIIRQIIDRGGTGPPADIRKMLPQTHTADLK